MASEPGFDRLRRRHPRAWAAAAAADLTGVELVRGPRAVTTVSCRGVLLASAYDPAGEGARLAEEMARQPADILVAIGFGLGHHLEAFHASNPCPQIVYEPSPACLRLALESRPWPTLLDRRDVHLCTSPEELLPLLELEYVPGLCIRTFVHPTALRLAPDAVRAAVHQLGRAKDAIDAVAATRVSMMERWSEMTVDNAAALLASPNASTLFGAFRGVPAVVVAAGPSLDRQLERLRQARERVLIVAIGQVLPALRAAGIEPDLVHIVESKDVAHQLTGAGDTRHVTLVVPPSVHPAVLEVPVGMRFIAYPVSNAIGCWIGRAGGDDQTVAGGATVAQSAVHLAAALGANPILLIGQDLAFSHGRVYASGSSYADVEFKALDDGRYALGNIGGKARLFGIECGERRDDPESRLVWVEGWTGEAVPTSVSYAAFIEHYRGIATFLAARGTRLVNCTEGGARLPMLEHLPFDAALSRWARERIDAASVLQAAWARAAPREPEVLREPLARVRRELARLEARASAALADARRTAGALGRGAPPRWQRDALQRLLRAQRGLRRAIGAAPWLDAVVQPEIHAAQASFRKAAAGAAPSSEAAAAEARMLFEAVLQGVGRARRLFARLAERIGIEPERPRRRAGAESLNAGG